MKFRFRNSALSLFLVCSLWFGGIVQVATAQQTAQQKQPAQTQTDKNKQTQSNKNLKENENPSLIGKRNINKGFGWFRGSLEKEIAWGRQLAAEVESQQKPMDDPIVTEYINRVGQNIVLHSDAKVPFTIKVMDSDEVNAFALPGGFFYVNKGLILAADNEAEIAGVMAHEIAHVAARHAAENYGKMQAMSVGLLAGMILTGGIGGAIIQNTAGILQGAAFMKFSRGAEEEADRLGTQYLYASGYDPNAMGTMFEKLMAQNQKKPNFFVRLFSSHPPSPERRDATLELASRFPEREEYIINTSEFQRVKSRLLRLSNSKVSSKGSLTTPDDNTPGGRPTLKRRNPTDDQSKPEGTSDSKPTNEPPKLKRNTGDPQPTPTPEL